MNWFFPRSFSLPVAVLRLSIAMAAVALCAGMQWPSVPDGVRFADEWLRDRFVRLQASDEAEQRVTVVDIDEASLAALGPWPWPRERMAALLERLLADYGARGVALDMVLPDPADAEGDARLAALAQHGPVVLAQVFDYATRAAPLRAGALAGGVPAAGGPAAVASGFIANHAGLARAKLTGNIGFVPDGDGVLRRLPMRTVFGGREYPSLSLALFGCCAMRQGADNAALPYGEAVARVPFARHWTAYTVIPAADVLDLRAPAALLAGRLVLVGSSALGLSDRVATPLSASTAGVMVHAAQLSSLLDAQAGRAPARWPGRWIAMFFSLLAAVLAVYAFPRLPAILNAALLGALALAWLGLAYAANQHDTDFSPAGPLLAVLFLLAVSIPFEWQAAQHESRRLLETLRQYVARPVVDELLRSKIKNPLAPARREVTTLIADMEGYTGQVEALTMEEAAQLTRDFLDCLTQPVLECGGTLDKYTGDGLVAFWGAPLPVTGHADLALDAAQRIVQAVQDLSRARQRDGKPPLRVRIGVESGTAMAGDFGSPSRSIYTAVGDSVNIASRLQMAARDFPHDIIAGEGTAALAARHRLVPLGEMTLRGKEKPTMLYALEPTVS